MEFKGTKGKWFVCSYDNNLVTFGPFYNNEAICRVFSKNDSKIEHANARLISKAPEMLEMLSNVSKKLEGNGFPSLKLEVDKLIKEATEI
ncbi:UNVERIFIED_CONTAM: hypothetical protein POZ17_19960 [Ralstonia mannitolilytica]